MENMIQWGENKAYPPPGCLYAVVPVDSPLSEDVDLTALLLADCDYAFVYPETSDSMQGAEGKKKVSTNAYFSFIKDG